VFQCSILVKINRKRSKERSAEEWETGREKKQRKLSKKRMKFKKENT
jgi:hypothetical protein